MNKKRVYITGALGFMGSHFTRKCLNLGWKCRIVDKLTYVSNKHLVFGDKNRSPEFTISKFQDFETEFLDINRMEHIFECDYIINFAAESDVASSIINSNVFVDTNIKGVHHLLNLIKTKFPHRKPTLIHISTDEVYGDIMNGSFKETDTLKPSNPYAASKASGDMLIQAFNRTFDIPYIILRPTNNYGIDQYPEKLIPRVVKCLNLGHKVPLHNNGTPVRSWLHAEDTAEAILHIIDKGVVNEIYNIGGSIELQNREVVERIIGAYCMLKGGIQGNIEDFMDFSYSRQGQDFRYSLDDSKLRNLGWSPKKDFNEELPKIVEYYLDKFIW